ncbi:MAG: hypothetical protein K6F39_03000 [Lachnospiraceae bacterium]|nr:hypothetical protein [Lachnospiraceae bacterium]
MIRKPRLKGKHYCGICNSEDAAYTVIEHTISYLKSRAEAPVMINGLVAVCNGCGHNVRLPEIDEYNAKLADEAIKNPNLQVIEGEAAENEESVEINAIDEAEVPVENNEEVKVEQSSLEEDEDGQLEFSSLIS